MLGSSRIYKTPTRDEPIWVASLILCASPPDKVALLRAKVRYSIVAENAVIEENAVVGGSPEESEIDSWGITVIGDNITIGKGAIIGAKQMIEEDIKEGECRD